MRVKVDIAQRTSNVTNEPGCLAISPSAFAFNEEAGRLLNSIIQILKVFLIPQSQRRLQRRPLTQPAHSLQRTEYAAKRFLVASIPHVFRSMKVKC